MINKNALRHPPSSDPSKDYHRQLHRGVKATNMPPPAHRHMLIGPVLPVSTGGSSPGAASWDASRACVQPITGYDIVPDPAAWVHIGSDSGLHLHLPQHHSIGADFLRQSTASAFKVQQKWYPWAD